ncbi:MAG: SDR family oxidoreductase [Alphaproteobacteria bacterium]|nr:SDR family oxidoreductase [Alphaproteobacteria bacterium]
MERAVLVTGGSKGIGRACVEIFAAQGARVAFTWHSDANAAADLDAWAARRGHRVRGIRSDARDPAAYAPLREAVRGFTGGGLDVLVNNAGDAIRRSSFAASDDALWTDSLSLNLMSAVRACHTFLDLLKASEAGVVVNVSSIAAVTTGAGDSLHYGVAKAALDTFTKGLARETDGGALRVVGVAPSAIATDFQTRLSSAERLDRIVAQTPAGRIGTAEEVGAVIAFLASPLAGYVSGAVLPITGGR